MQIRDNSTQRSFAPSTLNDQRDAGAWPHGTIRDLSTAKNEALMLAKVATLEHYNNEASELGKVSCDAAMKKAKKKKTSALLVAKIVDARQLFWE